MDNPEVKFGDWIQAGFNLYKENLVLLLVVGLITMLLGTLTLGILAGPLMVGMNIIVLRLIDKSEPAPEIGDVFKGFQFFLNAFLFVLIYSVAIFVIVAILGMVPCIGGILATVVPYVANAFLMFVLFLIPDQAMAFWPATLASIDKVKENFWPLLGLNIVASLIASVGAILCGVGLILTFPMYACIVAYAYRGCFGEGVPYETAETLQVEAAPTAETPDEEETVGDTEPEGEENDAATDEEYKA